MKKPEPAPRSPATMDFTALHDALAAGMTMEEAEAVGRGEISPPAPKTNAPGFPAGGAE